MCVCVCVCVIVYVELIVECMVFLTVICIFLLAFFVSGCEIINLHLYYFKKGVVIGE